MPSAFRQHTEKKHILPGRAQACRGRRGRRAQPAVVGVVGVPSLPWSACPACRAQPAVEGGSMFGLK
ncbi:unnamed protein product [Arctogadus glacialis]